MGRDREVIKNFRPRVTTDCKFACLVEPSYKQITVKYVVDKATDYRLYYDLEWNPVATSISNNGKTRTCDFLEDTNLFYEIEAEIAEYLVGV